MNNERKAVWAIAIGAFLSLVLPGLLTQLSLGIDFTGTGPIGDTIGGIVGPILNFTGLIVLYFSLREQFAANELQRTELEAEARRRDNERTFELAFNLTERLIISYSKAISDYDEEERQLFGFIPGPEPEFRQGMIMRFWTQLNPLLGVTINLVRSPGLNREQRLALVALLITQLVPQMRLMRNRFLNNQLSETEITLQIMQIEALAGEAPPPAR